MTSQQARRAAEILHDLAHEIGPRSELQTECLELAGVLDEHAREIIAAEEEAGRREAAINAACLYLNDSNPEWDGGL